MILKPDRPEHVEGPSFLGAGRQGEEQGRCFDKLCTDGLGGRAVASEPRHLLAGAVE